MKTRTLGVSILLVCVTLTQGITPVMAQAPAQKAGEDRTARIRRYLNLLEQKEAAAVEMPILGADRTNDIRQKLIRDLAEEVLSLREMNRALKREVEELKKGTGK